jgi:hypothetical protein
MIKQRLLFMALILCNVFTLHAQRYLSPQFTGVTKTVGVTYGQNFTALTLSSTGHTSRQPLVCDIYTPTGDTATRRPLVIYLPGGNFLPKASRRSPLGSRTDSSCTEFATRFAQLGYVSAVIDYRLFWNPIASQQTDRIFGLINAFYRGVQDGRTAIRFFKKNATTYNIDTNRIMVMGEGTGGYLSYAMATLDRYSELLTTQYPQGKFTTIGANGALIPMVTEALNGNINGSAPDTATISKVAPYPIGDTLHVPNHPANTSNYRFTINLGGGIADITWLDANSTPMACIGVPLNVATPYRAGIVNVEVGNNVLLAVAEVQGPLWAAFKADTLGLNPGFAKLTAAYDPYKSLVAPRNALFGFPATYSPTLLPILGRSMADVFPYTWWSKDTTIATNKFGLDSASLAANPGMSPEKARAYIDTIMRFIVPRACIGMALPCAGVVTSTEELLNNNTTPLTASPNPAKTAIVFESEVVNPIQAIQLFDMSGRQVAYAKVNGHTFTLMRNGLPAGMYIAKVKFEGGILSRKVVFED